VEVDSFNIELKDDEGFLGDRASKGAFRDILDKWRKPLRKSGEDPFGNEASENISKKVLDAMLVGEDTEASAVVHSAIEVFAQELAYVTRRFLKTKAWEKTERIVVGGGFRGSRLGELAIARTKIILKAEEFKIEVLPIRFHPDDAGLIGALHLAPSWIFEGHDSILAVDIGGTNIRCGVVEACAKKVPDLSKANVWKSDAACRRRAHARGRGEGPRQDAPGSDREGRQGGVQARALHRYRVSRRHQERWLHREGRTEPARQLGEQQVQPAS
jgi:hypothetical protein